MVDPADNKQEAHEPPPAWTDSDRAALEELLKEREHRKWASEQLKSLGRMAQWIAAIGFGGTLLWDWLAKVIKAAGAP